MFFFRLGSIGRLYSFFHLSETKPTFLPSFLMDLDLNEHILSRSSVGDGNRP